MSGPLGNGGAQSGGYQGLAGLMGLLQGGLNQSQFSNLQAGYTGANGAVGGVHGAFSGLSPWAVHFLSTQAGLFNKTPVMAQQSLTGPDTPQLDANGQPVLDANGQPMMNKGAGLTGAQLLMAQIHNSLAAAGPSQYKLADGVTSDDLAARLQDYATSSGHAVYAHGDNAAGVIPQGPHVVSGQMDHPWNAPKGVYGYGKQGNPFHSANAAKAANRFHKGGQQVRNPRG